MIQKEEVTLNPFEEIISFFLAVYIVVNAVCFLYGMVDATRSPNEYVHEDGFYHFKPVSNDCEETFTRRIEYIFPAHAFGCYLMKEVK